jgi:hypothetical protein
LTKSFVRVSVFLAQLAPIAASVALKEFSSELSGLFKGFEGTGRGDDLAERKLWLRFCDHRRSLFVLIEARRSLRCRVVG